MKLSKQSQVNEITMHESRSSIPVAITTAYEESACLMASAQNFKSFKIQQFVLLFTGVGFTNSAKITLFETKLVKNVSILPELKFITKIYVLCWVRIYVFIRNMVRY